MENHNKVETLLQEINKVNEKLAIMNEYQNSRSYEEIPSSNGFFKRIIKKIIRKLVFWYVEPVCIKQTEYNRAVTESVTQLAVSAQKIIQLAEEENRSLSVSLGEIKKENERLSQCLEEKIKNLSMLTVENKRLSKMLEEHNKVIIATEEKLQKLEELDLDIFKEKAYNLFDKRSTSQAGEDCILAYLFAMIQIDFSKCTYLDLGANHAKELSNTFTFYTHGARGVLVEANPALIPELKFYRSEDIILNRCVSESSGDIMKFYVLNGDGLSTPDYESAQDAISKNPDLEIIDEVDVESITVNEIMEKYFEPAPTIMNIDIEGKDLEILRSIDFVHHRPLVVITEMIDYSTKLVIENKRTEIFEFMQEQGYIEYAFTGINSIFVDKSQLKGKIAEDV